MRRCEWLVRAVLVFCLLYGVVAVLDRGHETFPFFAWDLFSKAPGRYSGDFSVRILEAHGLRVPLPVYFEAAELYPPIKERQGYQAIQLLGRTTQGGDKLRTALLRKRFEATYLNVLSGVRYQLVRRSFDIRKRIECLHCFIEQEVVGTYRAG
jgi:hypothetical protein